VRKIWENGEALDLIRLRYIDLSEPSLAEDLSSRIDRPLYEPVIGCLMARSEPSAAMAQQADHHSATTRGSAGSKSTVSSLPARARPRAAGRAVHSCTTSTDSNG